jgi:hypothetical protein
MNLIAVNGGNILYRFATRVLDIYNFGIEEQGANNPDWLLAIVAVYLKGFTTMLQKKFSMWI